MGLKGVGDDMIEIVSDGPEEMLSVEFIWYGFWMCSQNGETNSRQIKAITDILSC